MGFAAVHALPVRLRIDIIGTLNLFGTRPDALDPDTTKVGQALADVATIGLLQARAINQRETLAERHQMDMAQSFSLLRSTARANNRRLCDLARAVVDKSEVSLGHRERVGQTGRVGHAKGRDR